MVHWGSIIMAVLSGKLDAIKANLGDIDMMRYRCDGDMRCDGDIDMMRYRYDGDIDMMEI